MESYSDICQLVDGLQVTHVYIVPDTSNSISTAVFYITLSLGAAP